MSVHSNRALGWPRCSRAGLVMMERRVTADDHKGLTGGVGQLAH